MISNFRDLGGLKGYNGQTIKEGQLFRSSNLNNLSQKEIQTLISLNIHTIVDFRDETEKKEKPDVTIPSIDYIPINILGESSQASPDVKTMFNNLNQADELMKNIYIQFIISKQAQQGYRSFLNLLLKEESTPLVFHCTFGKDRTGFGAALILKILGVSESDIFSNYVKSNQELELFNEQILNELKKNFSLTDKKLNELKPLLQVNTEQLKIAFSTIKKNYQTFDNYLEKVFDFDAEKITIFREKYLS